MKRLKKNTIFMRIQKVLNDLAYVLSMFINYLIYLINFLIKFY